MTCTMLRESNLPKYIWTEVVNTACYILNRALIRPILKKIPYELWKDRKPNISYFHIFGCIYFIHNNGKDNLEKIDAKSDEGIFLGYSTSIKAYRVFKKRTLVVEESIHVVFDESNSSYLRKDTEDDEGILENKINKLNLNESSNEENGTNNFKKITIEQQDQELHKGWKYAYSHPKDLIIGDITQGIRTRSSLRDINNHLAFISQIQPKTIEEAELDPTWIIAMQEKLNQFKRNNVWTLVERSKENPIIGTK